MSATIEFSPAHQSIIDAGRRCVEMTVEERFWSHVDVRSPEECWTWTATRQRYGKFVVKRGGRWTRVSAHRAAFEIANGPITGGLHVLHRCDNTICVNPAHLWLGTMTDNMRDKVAKGRHHSMLKTHCPRGHAYTPENTRLNSLGRRECRTCYLAKLAARPRKTSRRQRKNAN